MSFSCEVQKPIEVLPIGKVVMVEKPLRCEDGMCYEFETSSELTADAQSGVIRINEPENLKGTLIMYYWGLGNDFYSSDSTSSSMMTEWLNSGYRIIQVKWDTGWFVGSQERDGFRNLAVHPASITKEIISRFSEIDKPTVLYGGSGGAAQIAYMLSFFGLDKNVDAAILWGGFWMGRLDIGCLDQDPLQSHLHYSDMARNTVDASYGYDLETQGPCALRDTTYFDSFLENSISSGGNYYYPDTEMHLYYAGKDGLGALNQGLTYYEQLISNGSPRVHMEVVDGSPHGIIWNETGRQKINKSVLSIINRLPTKDKMH